MKSVTIKKPVCFLIEQSKKEILQYAAAVRAMHFFKCCIFSRHHCKNESPHDKIIGLTGDAAHFTPEDKKYIKKLTGETQKNGYSLLEKFDTVVSEFHLKLPISPLNIKIDIMDIASYSFPNRSSTLSGNELKCLMALLPSQKTLKKLSPKKADPR